MRATVVVIDSFGIGAAPDADAYGDEGSNTALNICRSIPGEKWPVLRRLGLGNASEVLGNPLPGCGSVDAPEGAFGVMRERSPGKDTTTGHWEIAGIVLDRPFETFDPEYPSFPGKLIEELTRSTGREILGNRAASGTAIIEELGREHVETGKPIVYTSSDSVFQIAAHEEVIPVSELYGICRIARELCDRYRVARVIARPFVGTDGEYVRTGNRRDFSIDLPGPSVLELLKDHGVRTIGVGKIGDIFNEQGLTESLHDKGNAACIERTRSILETAPKGREFVFVNLVDTDMVYGHRRDVRGYFEAVSVVDAAIGELLDLLGTEDLFIVTADHGCDPTFRGTDHTREYVPLLAWGNGLAGVNLGIRESFADIAQSLAKFFGLSPIASGKNFLYR